VANRDQEIAGEVLETVRARILRDAQRADGTIANTLRFLSKNLGAESLTVSEIFAGAKARGSSIRAKFAQTVGITPRKYLEACKLEVVLRLIASMPKWPLDQVAEVAGYPQVSTLSDAFKRRLGIAPGALREAFDSGELALETVVDQLYSGSQSFLRPRTPAAAPPDEKHDRESDSFTLEKAVWNAYQIDPSSTLKSFLLAGPAFHTEALPKFLMEVSQEAGREDRQKSVILARLALDLLEDIKGDMGESNYANLRVEGLAYLGNCYRLISDWIRAERSFSEAEVLCQSHKVARDVEALLLTLKGHLRTFQRRFEEAQDYLSRAFALKENSKDVLGAIKLAAARGYCLYVQGKLQEALAAYEWAKREAASERIESFHLLYVIHTGLAATFLKCGKLSEANEHVEKARGAVEEGELETLFPIVWWQEALVVSADPDTGLELAESLMKRALESFEKAGEIENAALLRLDLALIHLEKGEYETTEVLVDEALLTLRALCLDTETLSAAKILSASRASMRQIAAALLTIRTQLEVEFGAPARADVRSRQL